MQDKGLDYIINVKPKSHKTLFTQIEGKRKRGHLQVYSFTKDGINHHFEYVNNVVLCNNGKVRCNFIQYTQTDKKGKPTTFTWVTNVKLNKHRVFGVMRAGRSRWKIENVPKHRD